MLPQAAGSVYIHCMTRREVGDLSIGLEVWFVVLGVWFVVCCVWEGTLKMCAIVGRKISQIRDEYLKTFLVALL